MPSQDEEMVDLGIIDLNVDEGEVINIQAMPSMTLGEIKKELQDMFDRPEILSDGAFVKQMPNGTNVPIHDAQKLGSRRELLYSGPPLRPPSEVPPPTNLLEFDGYDERIEIQSPRSVRAMELQGVSVEELYYAPMECFWEPGLDKMVMKLHHDFFEAFRQDSLAMCRAQRDRIIEEEGEVDESWAEQSTREWMTSVQSWWSKGKDDATTREPSMSLSSPSNLPRRVHPSARDERISGTGNIWAGALEPYKFPITNEYLAGIRYWMDLEKVFERPLQGEPKDPNVSKSGPGGSSAGARKKELADLEAPGLKARVAGEEIERMVKCLKSIPREKKRPQVAGLVLQTNSVAVVQRRKNSKARNRSMGDVKTTTEFMVSVAEAQKELADAHHSEVAEWRDHREACSQESRGPWKTTGQETNFANAYSRCDYWHERRDAVHQAQLDAEVKRSEANVKRTISDIATKRRVANIRDLTRIKFARNWLDRRIRWAKCETAVSKANDAWKTAIMNKQAEAQARVHDRNIRLAKFIEFKREYKSLRRLMQRMCEEREKNRQNCRREVLVDELEFLAEEADRTTAARGGEAASPQGVRQESTDEAEDSDVKGHAKDSWQRRRPMHLSMSSISLSTNLHSPIAAGSPTMSMTMGMTTPAASPKSPTSPQSYMPERRYVKRLPRFDFGRFGAESLTPLAAAAGTPSRGQMLGGSASLPNLAAAS